MAKVEKIPARYGSVTTYLVLRGAADAIAFYEKAFGAKELYRLPGPDGTVGHAELDFGGRVVMLADGGEQWPATSSLTCLYVEDCDAVFEAAVAAGATVVEPLSDKFYGDRAGTVQDPFGQRWSIMTHVEDVPPDEMQARMAKMMGG